MQPRIYAQALFSALADETAGEQESIFKRFIELLEKRGHRRLLPAIARALERIEARTLRATTVTLRVAKSMPAAQRSTLISSYAAVLPKHFQLCEVIDDTLISGFVLETADTRIDKSAKQMLMTLYRNILQNA